MKRWALLLVCIAALPIIGRTRTQAETAHLGPEVSGLAGQAPATSQLSTDREIHVLHMPPGGCIIVDGVVRFPCWSPDVRGFHPYPECEIVGMPFAGVKMCE